MEEERGHWGGMRREEERGNREKKLAREGRGGKWER